MATTAQEADEARHDAYADAMSIVTEAVRGKTENRQLVEAMQQAFDQLAAKRRSCLVRKYVYSALSYEINGGEYSGGVVLRHRVAIRKVGERTVEVDGMRIQTESAITEISDVKRFGDPL